MPKGFGNHRNFNAAKNVKQIRRGLYDLTTEKREAYRARLKPVFSIYVNEMLLAQLPMSDRPELYAILNSLHNRELPITEVSHRIVDFVTAQHGDKAASFITPFYGGTLVDTKPHQKMVTIKMIATQVPEDPDDLHGYRCIFHFFETEPGSLLLGRIMKGMG